MRYGLAIGAVIALWGRYALAGGGAATDAYDDLSESANVDVHGLADVYFLHNFNQPFSGRNQLRAFDFRSDQPSLGYLRLTVAHRPKRLGFRLDVGAGGARPSPRVMPLQIGNPLPRVTFLAWRSYS